MTAPRTRLAIILLSLLFPGGALGSNPEGAVRADIEAHLERFFNDPKSVMNGPLERWDAQGHPIVADSEPRFSREAIADGSALRARNRLRARLLGIQTLSEIQGNDRPEDLVDGHAPITTLEGLEAQGLRSAQLTQSPWSDDYWAVYKGVIAARYADPSFPKGRDWRKDYQYVLQNPASWIVQAGDPARIDSLSPAEKYELLVGDSSAGLTRAMWQMGPQYADPSGQVADWIGICQGWAAAALMLPRPTGTVNLIAADGRTPVTFYPSDVKALASLLWAEASPPVRFIGGRCEEAHPRTDAVGRVVDQDCFDTNPGTWHVAVTNQLGLAHRSFVLDAAYDYEVWNQPALGYAYRYFNPQSGRLARTLEQARVAPRAFARDKFRAYRSPRAASIVGVVMDLTYIDESGPSHAPSNSPQDDAWRTVRYFYDLELDDSGTIIGGEWYDNRHPDFLWVPEPDARAVSIAEDQATGEWSGDAPVPPSWRDAAARADASGQPLAKVVERLISWARPRQRP